MYLEKSELPLEIIAVLRQLGFALTETEKYYGTRNPSALRETVIQNLKAYTLSHPKGSSETLLMDMIAGLSQVRELQTVRSTSLTYFLWSVVGVLTFLTSDMSITDLEEDLLYWRNMHRHGTAPPPEPPPDYSDHRSSAYA